MKSFMKEFRDFINRGNVLDMAVGIIIGGAFTAIVSSLTSDIISPILGLFGGLNFDKYAFTFGEVTIGYGKFITAVINFLIMALIVFCIVKAMNRATSKLKKEEAVQKWLQLRCVLTVKVRSVWKPLAVLIVLHN